MNRAYGPLRSLAVAVGAATLGLVSGTGTAQGQESGAQADRALEEIVVTSRRREESVMEIPVAVSAFGQQELDIRGVSDIDGLSDFTPGFHFNFENLGRNDRGFNTLTFRGMDAGTFLVTRQPAQVFVNGIAVVGGNIPGLTDVERVEVIKGPQSAYFGRSTFSGAVNFITRDPGFDWRGNVSVDVSRFETTDAVLTVEGPLIDDKVAFRLSGRHYEHGGQYRNHFNKSEMLGARSTKSLAASIYAEPTDKIQVRAYVGAWRDDDGPAADTITGAAERNCDPIGAGQPTYVCGEVPFLLTPEKISKYTVVDEEFFNNYVRNDLNLAQVFGKNFITGAGLAREAVQATLAGTYAFDNGYALDVSWGWNNNDFQTIPGSTWYPPNPTPNPNYGVIPGVNEFLEQNQFLIDQGNMGSSFEARISSPDDARLRWLAGASVFNQEAKGRSRGEGAAGPSDGAFITDRDITATGIFAGVAYDLTDRVTVNLEARYQEDTVQSQVVDGPGGPGAVKGPVFKNDFTSFQPRVIVQYALTDQSNLYFSAAEGTRPGDFNTHLGFLSPAELEELEREGGTGTNIQEETLRMYELGWKGRFLDGRGRAAIAAYYGDWKDMQIFRNVSIGDVTQGTDRSVELTTSSGKSEVKGVELEAWYSFNDSFAIDMTAAYTDTELGSEYLCMACVPLIGTSDVTGNLKARSPKSMGTLGLNYYRPINQTYELFARADYLYKGTIYASDANLAETGAAEKVNARIGLRSDRMSIMLYATNIFDDKTYPSIGSAVNSLDRGTPTAEYPLGPARAIRVTLPDKPSYGIKVSYDFGAL